jgi:hypothetical protein
MKQVDRQRTDSGNKEKMISPCHKDCDIVYLDDTLIFSKSRGEHVEHVKEVLKRLQQNHLYCNPKKCDFFVDRLTYIGLVITPEGISMEKDKVQAVLERPTPTSVKGVQSVLGFCHNLCDKDLSLFPLLSEFMLCLSTCSLVFSLVVASLCL